MTDRIARLRRQAVRPRRTVPILFDGEVREQIEAVEDELDRLEDEPETDRRLSSKPKAQTRRAELEAELARLRASAEESTLLLVLEGLHRTAFRALLALHPPRMEDGKVIPQDRLVGANMETLAPALVRACAVGYRETNDASAPVLPFPPDLVGYKPHEDAVTLGFLFGFAYKDVETDEVVTVEPFCTERQVDQASAVAMALCVGDDAVPLPRRRSETPPSDAG